MPEALRATKTSRISGHSYRKRACHTSSELRAHGGIISVYISRRLQLIVLHNMHRFYALIALRLFSAQLEYLQEEKKKDAAKSDSDSLLPRWKGEESADKKYYVDSEM